MLAENYLHFVNETIQKIDISEIEDLIEKIYLTKICGGRLFFIGNGGSAATCSHAVNDFRKIAEIESYSSTDNVAELTARANDDGFDTIFSEWLKVNKLKNTDAVFVISVGGGNKEHRISMNIVKAIDYAKTKDAKVFGIVGKDGGYTKVMGDAVICVPDIYPSFSTPIVESVHSVLLHLIVSNEKLKTNETKWEQYNK